MLLSRKKRKFVNETVVQTPGPPNELVPIKPHPKSCQYPLINYHGNHVEQKISSEATFKCHKVTENQSPFQDNLAISALSNIWATPCDGVPECENNEDESQLLCNIPEEYSFFSLTTGYWTISVIMVVFLLYLLRKKIRIINPKHWPIG